MSGPSDAAPWSLIESRVEQALGLRADDAARARLVEGARQRMRSLGLATGSHYAAHLDGPGGAVEMHALAQTLTIGETYFFRGSDHYEVFAEQLVPERLAAVPQPGRPRLRVLSAGCSSGEEIYSLAMILADRFPALRPEEVELTGIDITQAALAKARQGVYTAWSLRDVPPDVIARHFTARHGRYELAEAIRRRVRFERVNLLDPHAPIPAGPYDAIFCRNVLIYFTPEAMRDVIARFESLLAPRGHLFLGHSESLRGLSTAFELCHSREAFFYRKLDTPQAGESLLDAEARRHYGWAPAQAAPAPQPLPAPAALRRPPRPRAVPALMPAGSPLPDPAPQERADPVPVLERAWACFRAERYADACALLSGTDEPEPVLLHALSLLHAGRVGEARARIERLRARHPLGADSACVLALCLEQLGQPGSAREQLHQAIYLDPAFAAPQLALARIAQRLGDAPGARRALQRAQQLLGTESEPRLLMFGGGFSATALRELAGSQLAGLGARA